MYTRTYQPSTTPSVYLPRAASISRQSALIAWHNAFNFNQKLFNFFIWRTNETWLGAGMRYIVHVTCNTQKFRWQIFITICSIATRQPNSQTLMRGVPLVPSKVRSLLGLRLKKYGFTHIPHVLIVLARHIELLSIANSQIAKYGFLSSKVATITSCYFFVLLIHS